MQFYLPTIGKVVVYDTMPPLLGVAPALAGSGLKLGEETTLDSFFPKPYRYLGMMEQDLCFEISSLKPIFLLHIGYESPDHLTLYTRLRQVAFVHRGIWQWKNKADKNISNLF